jgi:hypothetical protein
VHTPTVSKKETMSPEIAVVVVYRARNVSQERQAGVVADFRDQYAVD